MTDLEFVNSNSILFENETIECANKIFDAAETSYNEHISSSVLVELLRKHDFQVETGVANIKTSFIARYGNGKPVIGLLAEYDALHGLSQKPNACVESAVIDGGNGHGCGHNLLGAGIAHAALLVKKYLEDNKKEGTLLVFGCPAEENGSGKAFMAKAGIFFGLDAAFTWHPAEVTGVVPAQTMANMQVDYKFKGVSSHAAVAPDKGRSALDAVELMDIGANYLREHIISDARIHYAITDTGGLSPNVVPAHASVRYLLRAPQIKDVIDIKERVDNIARGAALMTGTDVEICFVKACSDFMPNSILGKSVTDAVNQIKLPTFTKDEIDFAEEIRKTTPTKEESTGTIKKLALAKAPSEAQEMLSKMFSSTFNTFILPNMKIKMTAAGSSDVGDVSQNCPTVWLNATTCAQGTPAHSWQMVAQGKTSYAHKGMIFAGKSLALSIIELVNNNAILENAWKEFSESKEGKEFVSPIPDGANPPIGLV